MQMNIDALIDRLRKAHISKSLRKLGIDCDVSHEKLRKLIASNCEKDRNITIETYNKINAGLTKNGVRKHPG